MTDCTPGPWTNHNGLVIGVETPERGGGPSFDIFDASEWPGDEAEGYANAELIAAALRTKQERDELLGGIERLTNITSAYLHWNDLAGKRPNLLVALKEARQLIERIDRG